MTGSPIDIVERFVDAWNRMDFETVVAMLSDDVFYHNIPMEPIRGRAAFKDFLDNMGAFDAIDWRIVNIAANANVVLTERVDEFELDGRRISLPLMGVFEIDHNGLIAAWRDYFDLEDYKRQRFG